MANEATQSISTVNRQFEAAFDAGDAAAVAEVYTEDGQILPPNYEPMSGKPAIQAFWQGAMDMGIVAAKLETVELDVLGDTAVEVGKGTLFAAGDQVADEAKYIVVWKREKGEWRWDRDIWNSSLPIADS